jgi:hypothetical protein
MSLMGVICATIRWGVRAQSDALVDHLGDERAQARAGVGQIVIGVDVLRANHEEDEVRVHAARPEPLVCGVGDSGAE